MSSSLNVLVEILGARIVGESWKRKLWAWIWQVAVCIIQIITWKVRMIEVHDICLPLHWGSHYIVALVLSFLDKPCGFMIQAANQQKSSSQQPCEAGVVCFAFGCCNFIFSCPCSACTESSRMGRPDLELWFQLTRGHADLEGFWVQGLRFGLKDHRKKWYSKHNSTDSTFDSDKCFRVKSNKNTWAHIIQVVPGRVEGGSFKRKKELLYIAKKEFAYRMCARRPTSAMPKPIFWCEQAFCRSMVVMSCALRWCVLMSWGRLRDWDEVMWLVVRWPVVS